MIVALISHWLATALAIITVRHYYSIVLNHDSPFPNQWLLIFTTGCGYRTILSPSVAMAIPHDYIISTDSNQPTPTNRLQLQPTNQPTLTDSNQPMNQPTDSNQTTNQPTNSNSNQPTNQPTNQRTNSNHHLRIEWRLMRCKRFSPFKSSSSSCSPVLPWRRKSQRDRMTTCVRSPACRRSKQSMGNHWCWFVLTMVD